MSSGKVLESCNAWARLHTSISCFMHLLHLPVGVWVSWYGNVENRNTMARLPASTSCVTQVAGLAHLCHHMPKQRDDIR